MNIFIDNILLENKLTVVENPNRHLQKRRTNLDNFDRKDAIKVQSRIPDSPRVDVSSLNYI